MNTFKSWDDVPENFTGQCWLALPNQHIIEYWIKPGKIIYREDGPSVITIRENTTMKYWIQNFRVGQPRYHRLDGPAVLKESQSEPIIKYFYINGCPIHKEEDYWNHPLVIQYKLDEILQTIK